MYMHTWEELVLEREDGRLTDKVLSLMTKSRVSCPPDKLLFQIMNQLINTNDQLINPPKSKPTSHILKVEG